MTTLEQLRKWKDSGAITGAQFDTIAAIVRKDRFSVFVELNALLYLGVLSFVAGLTWTIQTYFANLGDAAILIGLSGLLAGSLYYCFSRATNWSSEQVESPTMAFDYVLYLACLVFGAELAYIESRFHLLQDKRDYYLLISALLYFVFAYRFDNRFVLSLGLSTLAGWFGVKIIGFSTVSSEPLRIAGITYGAVVAGCGAWVSLRGIKRHFLETYLHIAANVLFIAFVSGIFDRDSGLYFVGTLMLAAVSIYAGVYSRRFAFVVYGTIYGYVAVSYQALRNVTDFVSTLLYFIVSAAIVIVAMVVLARRLGQSN